MNVCTETADWIGKSSGAMAMDPMYVMVYDSKSVVKTVATQGDEFLQEDGYSRTIMFVRFEDFMNW
jgi:hypothetical protein